MCVEPPAPDFETRAHLHSFVRNMGRDLFEANTQRQFFEAKCQHYAKLIDTLAPKAQESPNGTSIQVKTLTGKTVHLRVDSDYKFFHIKKLIEQKEGIPWNKQRIFCNDKISDDLEPLSKCGILSQIH